MARPKSNWEGAKLALEGMQGATPAALACALWRAAVTVGF